MILLARLDNNNIEYKDCNLLVWQSKRIALYTLSDIYGSVFDQWQTMLLHLLNIVTLTYMPSIKNITVYQVVSAEALSPIEASWTDDHFFRGIQTIFTRTQSTLR